MSEGKTSVMKWVPFDLFQPELILSDDDVVLVYTPIDNLIIRYQVVIVGNVKRLTNATHWAMLNNPGD